MQILGYISDNATEPGFTATGIESVDTGQVMAAAIAANPQLKAWAIEFDDDGEADAAIGEVRS